MKKKNALIFGITGQDGSYLAEILLKKKYVVHGVVRRSSTFNTSRIDHLYKDIHEKNINFFLHYGDITDSLSVLNLIRNIKPCEIYNLAAQSHVAVSFEVPEYTANADALGPLRILESIRSLKLEKKIKFYQAGTSEMYGKVKNIPQDENTSFTPCSPYGAAKAYSHWMTVIYRQAYGIFAANGILFNHESPRRGETFVTKKIVKALCKIKFKKQKKLYLGNLYSKRDWGHAKDYCEAMWKILQQKKPNDFVIATGHQYTVKQFINKVSKKLKLNINWIGNGKNEKGISEGKEVICIDEKYFRPLEVDTLLGSSKKAKKILNWKPKTSISQLIDEMISHELSLINDKKK